MKSLYHLASELQAFLLKRQWPYCFIGGIALQRWGQPRLTNDVDVTILTGFGRESTYVDKLLRVYQGRIQEARQFALNNRVLLLESRLGIPIDVALGGIPFEECMISRASHYAFLPDLSLLTCSAEDLVVLKAFADRSRDWPDIESILMRQEDGLDWRYIHEQLQPLSELKEDGDIIAKLERLRESN